LSVHTPFKLTQQGAWSYIYSPQLEESGIFHGFVTRPHAPFDDGLTEKAIAAFSFKSYVLMNQEHGDTVHAIRQGERPEAGDGIVLLEKDVAGIIKTADCLPIILYSSSSHVAAVVHAGWKGTALGIARKAVQQMKAVGVDPKHIGALIGPGIGPCCYQVQEDVAGIFRKAGFTSPVIQTREGAIFLDLKRANVQMLRDEGVTDIHDVDLCTCCREDLFYSARRDKGRGRQINFVLIRG
jgi:YfiH family protein